MGQSPLRRTPNKGKLAIPLPFDEALKAAVESPPPAKSPRKPPGKKPAKG